MDIFNIQRNLYHEFKMGVKKNLTRSFEIWYEKISFGGSCRVILHLLGRSPFNRGDLIFWALRDARCLGKADQIEKFYARG